jgi:DNA (cytosine-5)-methyltransferase 1
VDRLLKSPASRRGRDFAVMLASLSDLGYAVEWRIINAADYGFPQRRRRIFFVGYHKNTKIYKNVKKQNNAQGWILNDGVLAQAFPVFKGSDGLFVEQQGLNGDLVEITENFNKANPKISPFERAGFMIDRKYWTTNVIPNYEGKRTVLGDVLENEKTILESFFIKENDLPKWKFLKGAKDIKRKSKKTGHEYRYSEGAMVFPDSLDQPSRTIITAEGGSTPSRFKHVVKTKGGKLRRLVPVELERLNMFPAGHTKGMPDTKRAFMMGNALVVGIVKKVGGSLLRHIRD